jgi:LSD1 subclass zinc finger protein
MSNDTYEPNAETADTVKCKDCGASLKFAPGTQNLKCEYCNAVNVIAVEKAVIVENDYLGFIHSTAAEDHRQNISTVKCNGCGASTTLPQNVTSCNCPYCDTALVITSASTSSIIKPKYLLPFKVNRDQAKDDFLKWVGGLWFAPSGLKMYAQNSAERLKGIYMPYWTYDSDTTSDYSGLRGEYYYETETYRDSDGKQQTREVQRTAWYPASGTVYNNFDDILVCASNSLPRDLTRDLEPWDLPELVSYDDKFLAGFVTESYQVQLQDGFEEAKQRMSPVIETAVKNDIGGDTQQVHSINTTYDGIKFKHILLPLWISAYKYNNKVYRFTVNARTGEVQGERPWSALKIALLVITIAALIGGGIYFYKRYKDKKAAAANVEQVSEWRKSFESSNKAILFRGV